MTRYNKRSYIFCINAAIAALILVCFCLFYGMVTKPKQKEIMGVDFMFQLPIVWSTGESWNVIDTFSIYQKGDYTLYRLPYNFSLAKDTAITMEEKRYDYFFYAKGQDSGYMYRADKPIPFTKMKVDSALANRAFFNKDFYLDASSQFSRTIHDTVGYKRVTIYTDNPKVDPTSPDSSVYYFTDRMRWLNYSLSKKLEDSVGLRLCRVQFIFKPSYDTQYHITIPRKEMQFEIREKPRGASKEIKNIFRLFEKHCSKSDIWP